MVLTFPAGNRIQFYTIDLTDDVDVDKPEYFEVCLSNPMFGYITAPACTIIYIEDDDCKLLIPGNIYLIYLSDHYI